jgi:DNA processing protein
VTYRLASELAAAGIGIVSGLALGIDTVAHQAALAAEGYTIAVLGSGIDRVQPTSNRGLAERVCAAGGAVITEQEPGTPGLPQHFPARNRIIAGLSLGVIVTEAAEKSGALITVKFAREQNRAVMAVPGSINSNLSEATNTLLVAGAAPITKTKDVLDFLGLSSTQLPAPPVAPANKEEAVILKLLDARVSSSRELIARSGLSASRFAQVISLMEINGKVKNLGAATWVRR